MRVKEAKIDGWMDGWMDGGRDGCIVADKWNDLHPQLNKVEI